jgi:hypothetical protein
MGIITFFIIEMAIHIHDSCHARSEVLVLDDIKDLLVHSSSVLQYGGSHRGIPIPN